MSLECDISQSRLNARIDSGFILTAGFSGPWLPGTIPEGRTAVAGVPPVWPLIGWAAVFPGTWLNHFPAYFRGDRPGFRQGIYISGFHMRYIVHGLKVSIGHSNLLALVDKGRSPQG